ncbi:hypothetical protein [Mesorhizobium onobrychidis]|uniref:hypothetical protein n=1 Tax=Mesorhizobium onobrychidis TaxID=2775404 RepID=UPI003F8E8A12
MARASRPGHSLDQNMRLPRGADKGIPCGFGCNIAAHGPAACAQCGAMLQAASVAPLACQQFDSLLCVGNMSDRSSDADRNSNRLGKPSLIHGGTFGELNAPKRMAWYKVSFAAVIMA